LLTVQVHILSPLCQILSFPRFTVLLPPAAIKRYIHTFIRVVTLHEENYTVGQITFVCKTSQYVVKQYLELYETVKTNAEQRQKLEEELERVINWSKPVGNRLTNDKKTVEVTK